ncbi:type II toxin-antitoxin system VapB family antitoxin [Gilvimarinus polysaccharolyticus]|uniref:type II toxin-antitoxin system VapB family antitoxin n=1 Tax=Gilvimarinus polysaccharolyticus TaxID=863921 RepID=UPI000673BEDD|nr:type II toxin-antitoxin system VapB family antitoxin [Gilvimarinus polysaccharolyticus]
MKTASLFRNGRSQAVRLPKDFEFLGVSEVEIIQDGDSLILRPARKSWSSLAKEGKADPDFLIERPEVIEEGRVKL